MNNDDLFFFRICGVFWRMSVALCLVVFLNHLFNVPRDGGAPYENITGVSVLLLSSTAFLFFMGGRL